MAGATFPVRIVYGDRAAYAKGGLVDAALAVKKAGRYGDTEIIHINKAELAELKRQWGEPTINPETGMPEFFLGKIGKALKKVAKVALPIASVAANFIPGVGPLVSAGLGAAGGLLNGGGIGGALAGAAPGLLNGGMNQLTGGSFGPAQSVGGRPVGQAQAQASQTGPQTLQQFSDSVSPQFGGQNLVAQPPIGGKKPGFFNQDFLGINGVKNKHVALGGLLGAALLGGKKNKDPKQQTPEQFFGTGVSGVGGPLGGNTAGTVGAIGQPRTLNQRPMEDYYKAGSLPEYEYFSGPKAFARGGDVEGGMPLEGRSSFAVEGVGDGRADTVDALLSDGEYVMDAETVALLGNGSNKAGAKALDSFRVNLRKHKGKNLAKGSFSVKAKKPEAYLRKAG